MTVDIYWDATESMQGFTKLAAGNVFRNLPDTLSDIGDRLGAVNFFRFGENVTPVEGRKYRHFSSPETYTELITSFGRVLDMADPSHVSIVVTDLFENDADWTNVTQKIREKYFAKHLAVAIIGIKNSFHGKIYDVGLNKATFEHNSGDSPARYRPFYLFLMGPESQIRAFLTKWDNEQLPASEMNCVVFSEHFTTETKTLRLADVPKPNKRNFIEDRKLPKSDDRLQEVHIFNDQEPFQVAVTSDFKLYPYNCKLDIDSFEKRVKVFTLDESAQAPKSSADEKSIWDKISSLWQGDEPKAETAPPDENFTLTEPTQVPENFTLQTRNGWQEVDGLWKPGGTNTIKFTVNGNSSMLQFGFSPASLLPNGRIDLVQVQIVPTRDSLLSPDWIAAWDMGNIDIAPATFDASKTVNLRHIADSLRDSLLLAAQPTLVEFYLVVDKR